MFKDEGRRIRKDGGIENPKKYNKIKSPGKRHLQEDEKLPPPAQKNK
ncbi:MAG: hypothetical protein H0X33_11800 [Taibaiella sp.]|nr:hypothetical protein [Taibaiella sp.]